MGEYVDLLRALEGRQLAKSGVIEIRYGLNVHRAAVYNRFDTLEKTDPRAL
jgi:hypothetical protein